MKVLLEVDVDLIDGPAATEEKVAQALGFILEMYEFVADPNGEGETPSVYNVSAAVAVAETKPEEG